MAAEDVNVKKQEEILKILKPLSITLFSLAIITWLYCSFKVFGFSNSDPIVYEENLTRLTKIEKPIAKGLVKTGEFQDRVFTKRPKKGGYDLFEDVSNRNRSKKSD